MRLQTKKFVSSCVALVILLMPLTAGAQTTIGATKTGLLIWIAEAQGYFDSVPGGVVVEHYQSGTLSGRDLLQGKVDLATSSHFAFGSNALNNPDLRIVSAISSSRTCQLFARSDHGINTVADLAGKRIAVTKKSIGEFFLGQILTLAGIEADDVEQVHLNPKDMISAISAGEVDAAITWEPYVFDARTSLGENFSLLDEEQQGRPYYFLLTAKDGWLSENAEVAREIVRALKRAEEFALAEPKTAQQHIINRFGLSGDYLANLWPQHDLYVQLTQDLLFNVEEGIRWRREEGLAEVEEIPDVSQWVYLPALHDVSPHDVTIIR